MNDLISRQAVIDEAEEWISAVYCERDEQRERDAIKHVLNGIKKLPSAQPDLDKWCTDCKEYDSEKNCCPRWNRVIRKTVDELELNRQKGGKNDQYTGSRLAEGLRAMSG